MKFVKYYFYLHGISVFLSVLELLRMGNTTWKYVTGTDEKTQK